MSSLFTKYRGPPRQDKKTQKSEDATVASGNDAVFDQWLTHHLGQLYDPVAQEPIPKSLLRLLEEKLK